MLVFDGTQYEKRVIALERRMYVTVEIKVPITGSLIK